MADSSDKRMLPTCLCLDIETSRQDRTVLRELGAYRPDTESSVRLPGNAKDLVAQLDRLTVGATFVLGHNIVAFDQPALAHLYPGLALLKLPLVDTLELSPLAFPQNPYHRLVKDYKLCTTTRNDPVRDAMLAFELFLDQHQALKQRAEEAPDEVLCLHFLMGTENGKGVANFFASLRRALRPTLAQAQAAWLRTTESKACRTGQARIIADCLPDPEWHKPLAFALAWLRTAGGNSVLPPWVSRTFPKTRAAIAMLRDVPCADPECAWCLEQHDLRRMLPKYFPGIDSFRPTPATKDGKSLQRAIVENGFAGKPTLAILPTGGGKSLCFQLPALARYYRNGSLTVVISPLQSLMKDQVDNLEARGITCAGYLNGLLNPFERRAMLDKLRLGDLGLIFVAPEQFRNVAFAGALQHREIGAWVFDEAHCLSKWGHDFRPDYLYVSRFIKARQKDKPSPVFCFTATAKPDVVKDICEHFEKRLEMTLEPLEGGVSRENLAYEVRAVPASAKYPEVLHLLQGALREEEGGAIVFCARRKTVEEVAKFLKEAGLDCGYFHGGMESEAKRAVQEAFTRGELRVIAATNAFGMGVDKADVRLVIHLDTPGSLENYLQEAGRAGRDQFPARCILLFDDADMDIQFRLLRNSQLTLNDISSILKALRAIEKKDRSDGSVVVTSGEILLEIPEKQRIDPDAPDADTKVRIAVAWLEDARLLERQENHTRVFPGSLRVANMEDARRLLEQKLGIAAQIEPYINILSTLMLTPDDEGVSTDELMLATGQESRVVQAMLRDLDRLGLLSNDMEIGVTLYKEPDSAQRINELRLLEDALVACLRVAAPDAGREWQMLNFRRLCDTLRRDAQVDLDPEKLTRLLKSFAEPFGAGMGQRGFFALRPAGQDGRYVQLLRNWRDIEIIRRRRMRLAQALLAYFLAHRQGANQLVTCKQGELEAALKADVTLQDMDVRDWDLGLAAALMYLDTNEVLHLARGKAIFRSAMNIRLQDEARRRQFKKSDYAELALHYKDKIIQVHVMAEYARLALGKIHAAMSFIVDYFSLERDLFIRRYFAGRKDMLEMATTEAAHRRILTGLQNPEQQAIVSAAQEGNLLVLAGPGSGKTRVIVHRVAWLLRECMILPDEIMVLAYNNSAVVEIRRRLWNLVGADAAGVSVQTLHGLALRLTGASYAVAVERGESIDFDAVIRNATARLQKAEQGDDIGASVQRDRLLAGLRHLLVDEYQDINEDHYALISAVAGRRLSSAEDRLSLFAVGDDDQNIYAFGGAHVRFIRQFETDYQARRYHLIENYRSTAQIIDCANRVISRARERMKTGHEIRIDHARRDAPPGGDYAKLDPITGGRVHVIEAPNNLHREVQAAVAELERIAGLDSTGQPKNWGRFAVIARQWEHLEPMATLCRLKGIPVRLLRDGDIPDLHTTREGHSLLTLLRSEQTARPHVLLRPATLSRWFRRRYKQAVDSLIEHPARAALAQFIQESESVAPGAERVVADLIDALYEFRTGGSSASSNPPNGPLLLLSAHRAKGLEFDHVLILDGGGWGKVNDEERRLFYVSMTRARKTLTLMQRQGRKHSFIRDCAGLSLHSVAAVPESDMRLDHRIWGANQDQVWLSWPGKFLPNAPVHRAIAALDYGSPLQLRPRSDGMPGWELADQAGMTVSCMSRKFAPPPGAIVAVRVAAVLVRHAKADESVQCKQWELVLPEIEYCP